MVYEKLYSDFASLFPDKCDVLNDLASKSNTDECDGMHIMFSFVVVPFVLSLFHNNEEKQLQKAFDFFEQMASSNDSNITEVLEFTIVENLLSNGKAAYDGMKPYMGKETLKCCKNVEQYLNISD